MVIIAPESPPTGCTDSTIRVQTIQCSGAALAALSWADLGSTEHLLLLGMALQKPTAGGEIRAWVFVFMSSPRNSVQFCRAGKSSEREKSSLHSDHGLLLAFHSHISLFTYRWSSHCFGTPQLDQTIINPQVQVFLWAGRTSLFPPVGSGQMLWHTAQPVNHVGLEVLHP